MVGHPRSIAAALVAVLFVTTAAAEERSDDAKSDNDLGTSGTSLRGGANPLAHLSIPHDDARRTTDPFKMAAAANAIWDEIDDEEDDIDFEHTLAEAGYDFQGRYQDHRSRSLQDCSTAKNRARCEKKKAKSMQQQNGGGGSSNSNNDNDSSEGECSGSRPRRCGCPNVFQSDYRGRKGSTENGFACRQWKMADEFPGNGLEDGPYCRNPDQVAGRAWCFVNDPSGFVIWDYCNVRQCNNDGVVIPHKGTVGNNVGVPGCVTSARYDEIDADVEEIARNLDDDIDKSHFKGGCLRLAAHDFMDFDKDDRKNPMGMDGCLDWTSQNNAGLNTIWNEHSPLFKLYQRKYSDISRADFWVIVANAIVRQTSVDSDLDLKDTFLWGRREADECEGSAERLPSTENCQQVEDTFLTRMGMEWKDAVALLGAHTLGRGHDEFSGHHGTWMPNDKKAQVFDKQYYQELVARAWSPRNLSKNSNLLLQDWTTGEPNSNRPKMMLNTDICLVWDIDDDVNCCTKTDLRDNSGRNRCISNGNNECRKIEDDHPRATAAAAVNKYLGGSGINSNNKNFYRAFRKAWFKATMNGHDDLKPLMDTC